MLKDVAISTDFMRDDNIVRESLALISKAGFKYIHWCQQWKGDYIYTCSEIKTIRSWLREEGLKCQDLHATAGKEKDWGSYFEYSRKAGVDLIKNRIEMAKELGADAIVLHLSMFFTKKGKYNSKESFNKKRINAMKVSLSELVRFAESLNIKIAFENMPFEKKQLDLISDLITDSNPKITGICYDSGHGNIIKGSIEWLERWKDRLFVTHLHDNYGKKDKHLLPFNGNVDFNPIISIIRDSSSYKKAITLEVGLWATKLKPYIFLKEAKKRGERLLSLK